ncbi:MAG: hypothetical protein FWH40_04330 [Coriobacteriia bacterium]|nr:hypothetical protein [Coriobacteriia bacterium]
MLVITAVSFISVMFFNPTSQGYALFGAEMVQLILVTLVAYGSFLEFYTSSLADDKKDGILALVMFCGMSRLGYFAVKTVVPLIIALIFSLSTLTSYFLLVSAVSFEISTLLFFIGIILSELFLSMGLGMLLNILFNVDTRSNPGVVWPLVLANLPLFYFANPFKHFLLFNLLTVFMGLTAYAVSFLLLQKRYRSNLSG